MNGFHLCRRQTDTTMTKLYSALLIALSIGYSQGAWSSWGAWSPCSQSVCGEGIRIKTRVCDQASPCPGYFYLVEACFGNAPTTCDPVTPNTMTEKTRMACIYFVDERPVYGYGKQLRVGNCIEVCESHGKDCEQALKIYPNPQRRLDRNEPQVYQYPDCATIHSNACCCVDKPT